MGNATLKWVLQLHKDVPKAARFYSEGLDFTLHLCTLRWAHLQSGPLNLALLQPSAWLEDNFEDGNFVGWVNCLDVIDYAFIKREIFEFVYLIYGTNIISKAQYSHSRRKGHSSMLSFTVTDLHGTVTKLKSLGAELDGPIKHEIHGKVAALRCLDGHIIGLYEPL